MSSSVVSIPASQPNATRASPDNRLSIIDHSNDSDGSDVPDILLLSDDLDDSDESEDDTTSLRSLLPTILRELAPEPSHNVLVSPPFDQTPTYNSLDELVDAARLLAAPYGFDIIRKPKSSTRIYLQCSFSSSYSSNRQASRRREVPDPVNSRSRKTDCPWVIRASTRNLQDPLWRISNVCQDHNHPPSRPEALPSLRSLSVTSEVADRIHNLFATRTRPIRILEHIRRDFPGVMLTAEDLHSRRRKWEAQSRPGNTATEACVRELEKNGELYRPYLNGRRQLLGLVYTTATARALLHRFPTVIFIDCTYKTNRYRMPMLHIVGFTCTNQTFTAGIALMLRETTDWYDVAFEAFLSLTAILKTDIKVVITDREVALHHAIAKHLPDSFLHLCTWHIGENVKKAAKSSFFGHGGDWKKQLSEFRTKWWQRVVCATTETGMEEGMAEIRAEYAEPRYRDAIEYLEGLLDFKEQWVQAYTDRHKTLGQHGNSRIEGNHRALKDFIDSKNGDIIRVVSALKGYFSNQWLAIIDRIERQRTRPILKIHTLFNAIKARVSRHAIALVQHQIDLRRQSMSDDVDSRSNCSDLFKTAFGLPCSHDIDQVLAEDRYLSLDQIDRHWQLPTSNELTDWVNYVNRIAGAPNSHEVILPNEFDYDVESAVVHNPPINFRRAHDRSPPPSARRSQVNQEAPDVLPTGRISTAAERAVGRTRTRRVTCRYCNKRNHRSENCPVEASRESETIRASGE